MGRNIKNLIKKYESVENLTDEEVLKKSLLKKAKGFVVEEIVEEYSKEDESENLKLNKRKVTTKEVPPDTMAIKVLMEMNALQGDNIKNMSDEELEVEKNRLLNLLKGEEVGN